MTADVEYVCLGLGTNLGERERNLRDACRELAAVFQFEMFSRVYETAPWGVTEQPQFLNLCVVGRTELEPLALLKTLKAIEAELGRTPTFRYGPRLIDMDILLYGGRVIDSESLTVPHPHMTERAFVMIPLNDIAASFRHPTTGEPIASLAKQVENQGVTPIEPQPPFPPRDLLLALAAVPGAQQAFLSLPPSHAREYLTWLTEARKPETRARRCLEITDRIKTGGRYE